jgi:MFS transporter, DHA1 family, multidrug resistance protein
MVTYLKQLPTWQRNLWTRVVAQTLTGVAYSFTYPFVPLFVQTMGSYDTTEAAQWAGVIAASASLAMAVAQPVWGNMADRWGRKPMIVRAMAGGAITTFIMGLVVSPEQLLLVRLVQGSLMGTVAASTALVASTAPQDRLGFSLGLIQVAMFLGNSVGPLMGGVIADTLGYRFSFAIAGSLMVIGTALVVLVVREIRVQPRASVRPPGLWEGSKSVLALPFFPSLLFVIFMIQIGGVIVSPVLSLFIAELGSRENAATSAGLVIGATGMVSAVSAVVIGRLSDRMGRTRLLPVCLAGAAVAYFPQALVQQVWQLMALRMTMGVFLGGLMPTANALVASLVPEERRGSAYGLTSTASALSHSIGPLMAAVIVSHWGMRPVFLTTAIIFGLVFCWVTYWLSHHQLPAVKSIPPRK